ncbi:MAG: RHS repeat-associated core domain-containing protein [Verrucomicrobiota bacterium]
MANTEFAFVDVPVVLEEDYAVTVEFDSRRNSGGGLSIRLPSSACIGIGVRLESINGTGAGGGVMGIREYLSVGYDYTDYEYLHEIFAVDPTIVGLYSLYPVSAPDGDEVQRERVTFTIRATGGDPEEDPGEESGGISSGGCGGGGSGQVSDTIPSSSLRFGLGMGLNEDGDEVPVGSLTFGSTLDHSNPVTRDKLAYRFLLEYYDDENHPVHEVGNPDLLRQIRYTEGLAEVVDQGAGRVDINFYDLDGFDESSSGASTPTQDYTITGDPIKAHVLETPSDLKGYSYGIQMTSTEDPNGSAPTSNTTLMLSRQVANGWEWREERSDREEIREGRETVIDLGGGEWEHWVMARELVFDSSGGTDVKVSERTDRYESKPWGGEELVQTDVLTGMGSLSTTYFYHETAGQNGYGQLDYQLEPDGSWVRYDYDSFGRLEYTYEPWLDGPTIDSETGPDVSGGTNVRSTRMFYAANSPAIEKVEVTIDGTLISRTVYSSEATTDPFDSNEPIFVNRIRNYWGAGGNEFVEEVTIYKSKNDPSAPGGVVQDGVKRHANPNGLVTNYDGSTSWKTIAVAGTIDTSGGSIPGWAVVPGKSTKDDHRTGSFGPTRSESFVHDGANFVSTGVTWYNYVDDELDNVTKDGVEVRKIIRVSDTETLEIDEYGIETVKVVDGKGQLQSVTRVGGDFGVNGVQADVITSYNRNGLTTTTTTIGGTLSEATSTIVDLAGRLVSNSDATGINTTYTYPSAGVEIEHLPGGAYRKTVSYADGKVFQEIFSDGTTEKVLRTYEFSVNNSDNAITETIYEGTDSSPRWSSTKTDMLGRVVESRRPGPGGSDIVEAHFYDPNTGLRTHTTRTGLATVYYGYDEMGQLVRTGLDLDSSGGLSEASTDRIEDSSVTFEQSGGTIWQVTTREQFLNNGSAAKTLISEEKEQLNGVLTTGRQVTLGDGTITTTARNVDRVTKVTTEDTTSNQSTLTATVTIVNGRVVSRTSLTVGSPETYGYDDMGRRTSMVDSAGVIRTAVYNSLGQLVKIWQGNSNIATDYTYYPPNHISAGLVKSEERYPSSITYYAYDAEGRVTHVWGNGTYPLKYVYNTFGELEELHTYRSGTIADWSGPDHTAIGAFGGDGDITRWNYDADSGALRSKEDAAVQPTDYTYHASGLLWTRTWARGITTTYGYDGAGNLQTITYSDSTPSVTHTYDRAGRRKTTQDAVGLHTYAYGNTGGRFSSDTITAGTSGSLLDGVTVTVNESGGLSRRSGLTATLGAATLINLGYTYHPTTGRLETITSGDLAVTYGYQTNSDQVDTIESRHNGQLRLTGNRDPDGVGRLDEITYTDGSGGVVSEHDYVYDDANRRTDAIVTPGTDNNWKYEYNTRNEVEVAFKTGGTTAHQGWRWEYDFDSIGNRKAARSGDISDLREIDYVAGTNALNQYASIANPDSFDVVGEAESAAAIMVNGQTAERRGGPFWSEVSVNNTSGPVWADVEVEGVRSGAGLNGQDVRTSQEGNRYVPPAAESLTYDDDGNLTGDGRWGYEWNGENRLFEMATQQSAVAAGVPEQKLVFVYDYQGRRVQKRVYDGDGDGDGQTATWTLLSDERFVYDGWNLVAKLEATGGSSVLKQSYVWGLDVAGQNGGAALANAAGGVGGLLAVMDEGMGENWLPGYDGNGNVMVLVAGSDGAEMARFQYGAFGEVLRKDGVAAESNPFQFSTKYADQETGLLYYGFRYYEPRGGKFISRDPIEEHGLINLYGFVGNNPLSRYDYLGLLPHETLVVVHIWGDEAIAFNNVSEKITRVFLDPIDPERLKWKFVKAKHPGKTRKKGLQASNVFDGEKFKCVFFVEADFSPELSVFAPELLGYGIDFETVVYVKRIEELIVERKKKGTLPPVVDRRPLHDVIRRYFGLALAHEVLHAVGAGHRSTPGVLMEDPPRIRLIYQPVPVSKTTIAEINRILNFKSPSDDD